MTPDVTTVNLNKTTEQTGKAFFTGPLLSFQQATGMFLKAATNNLIHAWLQDCRKIIFETTTSRHIQQQGESFVHFEKSGFQPP